MIFYSFSRSSTSGKQLFHSMARGLVPYPADGMARALFQSMARGLVPYLHQLKGMERLLSSPALRAGRTTQPLKQQQTLQSSRRLERQSSQEQDRTAQEQSRTAEELFHTFQYVQVWNKPPCHTLEQGPCHTLRRVWYKPSCHTVEQLLARGRALGKGIKIHCHMSLYIP